MFTDAAGGNNNEAYDAFGECWSVVDGATPVSQQNLSPMAHAFQPQGGVDHLGGVPMAYQSGPSAQGMCARPAACFMQQPTMMKPAVHPLGSLDDMRMALGAELRQLNLQRQQQDEKFAMIEQQVASLSQQIAAVPQQLERSLQVHQAYVAQQIRESSSRSRPPSRGLDGLNLMGSSPTAAVCAVHRTAALGALI